jgi:hypothetical protein
MFPYPKIVTPPPPLPIHSTGHLPASTPPLCSHSLPRPPSARFLFNHETSTTGRRRFTSPAPLGLPAPSLLASSTATIPLESVFLHPPPPRLLDSSPHCHGRSPLPCPPASVPVPPSLASAGADARVLDGRICGGGFSGVRGWKTGCRRSPAHPDLPAAASPPRGTRPRRCISLTAQFWRAAEIGSDAKIRSF